MDFCSTSLGRTPGYRFNPTILQGAVHDLMVLSGVTADVRGCCYLAAIAGLVHFRPTWLISWVVPLPKGLG